MTSWPQLDTEVTYVHPKSPDLEPFLAVAIYKNDRVVDASGASGIRECGAEIFSSFCIPLSCLPAVFKAAGYRMAFMEQLDAIEQAMDTFDHTDHDPREEVEEGVRIHAMVDGCRDVIRNDPKASREGADRLVGLVKRLLKEFFAQPIPKRET